MDCDHKRLGDEHALKGEEDMGVHWRAEGWEGVVKEGGVGVHWRKGGQGGGAIKKTDQQFSESLENGGQSSDVRLSDLLGRGQRSKFERSYHVRKTRRSP